MFEHDSDALFDRDPGRPANEALNLGDIGMGDIGLARPLRQRHRLPGTQEFDQPIDRDRLSGAEIECLAGIGAVRDRQQTGDGVCHVGEVAGLGAVADDGEGLPGAELREEHAEYRAIGPTGPGTRAVDIEKAYRDGGKAVELGPVNDKLLAEIFGQRVRVAGICRCCLRRRVGFGDAVAG